MSHISPTFEKRPEVGGDIPAHFPEGRRRFIQWVRKFGHQQLARELGMPPASGRATVHSWTNLQADRFIAPATQYLTHIVELSRENPFGLPPLTLEDLLDGTGGLRGSYAYNRAFRFLAPGVKINLLQLDMQLVTIEVIAKLLANTPRYGGAAGQYSVAQHSCLGAEWLLEQDPVLTSAPRSSTRRKRAFDFLMHDSHEAILQDVISPIIRCFMSDAYRQRKREIDLQMAQHYGYRSMENNEPGSESARRIDQAMLSTEEMHFFGEVSTAATPLPIEIEVWDPQTSYLRFLELFHALRPVQEVAA